MTAEERFARIAHTDGIRKDLKSKSVRGAAFMAGSGAGDFVLRIVSVAIMARLLVPEHFGLIGMVTAFTSIAAQISHMGLSAATVQRQDITHRQVSNLFWINFAFGALLCAILCSFAPAIAAFYHEPRLLMVTIALSTNFLFGGLTVQHIALLDRQMKQAQSSLVRFGVSIVSTGLAVFLAFQGYNYWALVWQEVTRAILLAVGMWIFCPWIPSLPHRGTSVRSLLHFGANLTLAQLLYAAVASLDRLLLGRIYGASSVGIFRQAQQLIMAPIDQLNGPIQSVAQPGLSMLQNDPVRYLRYYQKIVFVISLVTMPMAVFAAVYAEDIALIVLGPKWSATVPLFRIFALVAFIRPVLATSGIILVTSGRSKLLLRLAVFRCVGLIVFMFIGAHWGSPGMALAHFATTLLFAFPNLYFGFAHSPVHMRDFFFALRNPLLASLIMTVTLWSLNTLLSVWDKWWAILPGFGVGIVVYAIACLLLPGSRTDMVALYKDVTGSLGRRRGKNLDPAKAA